MKDKNTHIEQLMERYFSSLATPAEIEELNAWLEEDKAHLRQFLQQKNLYEVAHPAFPVDALTIRKGLQALRRRLHKSRRLSLWGRMVAAAAVVVLLVGGTWFLASRMLKPVGGQQLAETTVQDGRAVRLTLPSGEAIFFSGEEAREVTADSNTIARGNRAHLAYTSQEEAADSVVYHELSVPRGSDFFLELSDGTKIWMNAETSVRYPARFPRGERKIFVNGEAYLEVARDTAAPFTVVMAHNEVTVLGTAFNVNSYPEQAGDRVTLVSGRVSVYAGTNGERMLLQPGEQAVIPRTEGNIEKRKVDTRLYCSWKDGVLVFKNNTLEDMLALLARQYDVEFYWHDELLKTYPFTGELRRYDTIDSLLYMMELTGKMKFTVHGKEIIVARP